MFISKELLIVAKYSLRMCQIKLNGAIIYLFGLLVVDM